MQIIANGMEGRTMLMSKVLFMILDYDVLNTFPTCAFLMESWPKQQRRTVMIPENMFHAPVHTLEPSWDDQDDEDDAIDYDGSFFTRLYALLEIIGLLLFEWITWNIGRAIMK